MWTCWIVCFAPLPLSCRLYLWWHRCLILPRRCMCLDISSGHSHEFLVNMLRYCHLGKLSCSLSQYLSILPGSCMHFTSILCGLPDECAVLSLKVAAACITTRKDAVHESPSAVRGTLRTVSCQICRAAAENRKGSMHLASRPVGLLS